MDRQRRSRPTGLRLVLWGSPRPHVASGRALAPWGPQALLEPPLWEHGSGCKTEGRRALAFGAEGGPADRPSPPFLDKETEDHRGGAVSVVPYQSQASSWGTSGLFLEILGAGSPGCVISI